MENITSTSLIFHFFFSPFIILLISLGFLKFIKLRHTKSTSQLQLPPGPKPWPLVGCLPQMLQNKPVFRWIHNLMKELDTEIACIRLGNVHVIPVTCPKIGCQFLKAQDSVFANRPLMMSAEIASTGYLTTALVPVGEQWQKMKRLLVKEMLSPSKHKLFYSKRLEEANHLVRYVYNLCTKSDNGGLVNIRFVSQHYCANLIRNILFNKRFFGEGKKDGGPSYEDEEHVDAIFTLLSYLYAFSVSDYLACLKGFDLDGHQKVMKEAANIMRKYQNPIIQQRFHHWSIGNHDKDVEDLLDMFITLKDANGHPLLSKEEIQAQITEIMIEVVDNPSNALEWGLAEMINQPEILAKAVEELDRVVGKERLVEESDFCELNYVKACAREAFRLHPIAPFNVPHVAMADTTVGNYFIPKGSHVLLSRVGLGRNPNVWDEPEKFKPERHLKEGFSQVTLTEPDLRFISFSTGKRRCPGIEMGTSMTVMLFARLLQGFSWSAPSNKTSIDLTESANSLALAKPLVALGIPRLPPYLYQPAA